MQNVDERTEQAHREGNKRTQGWLEADEMKGEHEQRETHDQSQHRNNHQRSKSHSTHEHKHTGQRSGSLIPAPPHGQQTLRVAKRDTDFAG